MKLVATLVFCVSLLASAASAQSVFVAAVAGAETLMTPSFEVGGEPSIEGGGTAPFVGARVGLAIGANWGVELEAIQNFGFERTQDNGSGPFPLAAGAGRPAITGSLRIWPVTIETETSMTTWTPSLWLAHAFNQRVSLVVLGGAAFTRSVSEQDIDLPDFQLPPGLIPSNLLPIDVGILDSLSLLAPQSTRAVSYDVAPMVGADVPFAFGERFRVAPGVRLSGRGGTWTVRSAVSVGWQF